MISQSIRIRQNIILWLSFLVLVVAFYLEYLDHLEPCPLCLMQRFCVLMIFLMIFTAARCTSLKYVKLWTWVQLLFACAGLFFVCRHLWILSLSDKIPACVPGLKMMIRYFPWRDVLSALFWGTASCTELQWSLLGLSMPAWAGLYFLFVIILSGSILI